MNRNRLKYLAALAMLFDHLGAMFIPIRTPFGLFCRLFGRLTAPIMCYFLAEGFVHTRSREKYILRVAVFALIAQPAYSLAFHKVIWAWDFNMLFTMLLSLLMLLALEKLEGSPWRWPCVLLAVAASYHCDWQIIGPLWVLLFYLLRGDRKKQLLAGALVLLLALPLFMLEDHLKGYRWRTEFLQAAGLLAMPLLSRYNGEKGSGGRFHKWFFYVLYPAHLYLYVLIRWLR